MATWKDLRNESDRSFYRLLHGHNATNREPGAVILVASFPARHATSPDCVGLSQVSGLHSNLKVQCRERQTILVLRVHIADGSIGLLQLSLTDFDDRAQAKLIAPLRELQAQVSLLG